MFKWFTSPSTSTPFASCQNSPYLVDNLPLPPTTEESILIATDNSNSVTTTQENKDGGDITALNTLLEVFTASALPPTARTDPTVAQIQPLPMKFSRVWEYVPFLTSQGTALTKAFVNHHLYGPPKPSWGVELTLFTSFLREAAAYSHLSSIHRLRSVLDLGTLLPTPKDGIVTPISFRVKRRGLRGFLAQADAAETGKRQITGEWVINKRLWKRMQTEFAMNKAVRKDRVILYLHGGAYYMMSAETHRFLTISVSRYTESRVFAINYRLAPETRFPGQLHDAVSAYMRLIIDLQIPPENIVFAGDSAGAGLAVATMMYLRDEGYPLPSGAILMSPWVDLTMSCESWTTNQPFDYLPQPKTDDHLHPVKCLLGDQIDKYLCHPYVSPLFGNFTGLPPLLIQAGDAEVLRDEITLLAHKASLAGVSVDHEIFEDCVHVFQAFLFLEASRKSFQSQRHFVKVKLPTLKIPKEVDMATTDAEIQSDAHVVNQEGKADLASLPATPSNGFASLHVDLSEEETDGAISDSSHSSREATTTLSSSVDTIIPAQEVGEDIIDYTIRTTASLPASPRLSSSSSRRSRPSIHDSGTRTPPIQRPLARTLASTRDLLMSRSNPASPSSIHPLPPLRSSHSSVHFETDARPLHARSSSHPNFQALLEEYEEKGPANRTKIFSF